MESSKYCIYWRMIVFLWILIFGLNDGWGQDYQLVGFAQPPVLEAFAGEDFEIQAGETVSLGAPTAAFGGTPPFSFIWQPSSSLSDCCVANPLATPDSTTWYTLTVIDAVGCTVSDLVLVSVVQHFNGPPIRKFYFFPIRPYIS